MHVSKYRWYLIDIDDDDNDNDDDNDDDDDEIRAYLKAEVLSIFCSCLINLLRGWDPGRPPLLGQFPTLTIFWRLFLCDTILKNHIFAVNEWYNNLPPHNKEWFIAWITLPFHVS